MSPEAWGLFLACALGAEIVGTMAGFGAATILTPFAALFLDMKTAIAMVADATRIPVYLASGLIPRNLMPVLASLVVVAFAGSWIGQRLVRRLSTVWFRRFVLVMLALMGIKLMWRG